jgi:hypothetical protein
MEVERNACRVFGGKARRKEEDLDVARRIILKWILDRMGWYGLD